MPNFAPLTMWRWYDNTCKTTMVWLSWALNIIVYSNIYILRKCTILWGEPDRIHAEHGAVTCIWLSSERDWTSGHRKSHEIYTCTQELWVRHRWQPSFTCATGSLDDRAV